ncbi:hypothetical protein [Polyangium sorediatum]|uniref:Uncharacterized protein n=1 Tax=Polyangium sorediatum TaxID=889274 RepID=A0ABT6NL33_9BACT|nr:hypothetical protein [Polyangium sorediatum]MDI1429027.1 hypothetical protein [Polyangium sorediatum]
MDNTNKPSGKKGGNKDKSTYGLGTVERRPSGVVRARIYEGGRY